MAFQDHFSGHASLYTRFRPGYPRGLFQFLAALPAGRGCAWDCGTGNGQAAVGLAEFFEKVIATDPSAEQIAHAWPHAGVEYRLGSAEEPPLAGASVDLITVAQALHWFDLPRFYVQVRRVARPGGILAAWTYALAKIDPAVDRVIWHLYRNVLGADWPLERKLVEERYATIDFPFEEVPAPRFAMSAQWNFDELIGYLGTWSATQRYLGREGKDPVDLVRTELADAWGAPETVRDVAWPLDVRVGRVG